MDGASGISMYVRAVINDVGVPIGELMGCNAATLLMINAGAEDVTAITATELVADFEDRRVAIKQGHPTTALDNGAGTTDATTGQCGDHERP